MPNSLQILLHDAPRILKSTVQKEKNFFLNSLTDELSILLILKGIAAPAGEAFLSVCTPDKVAKKRLETRKRIHKSRHMRENVIETVVLRKD